MKLNGGVFLLGLSLTNSDELPVGIEHLIHTAGRAEQSDSAIAEATQKQLNAGKLASSLDEQPTAGTPRIVQTNTSWVGVMTCRCLISSCLTFRYPLVSWCYAPWRFGVSTVFTRIKKPQTCKHILQWPSLSNEAKSDWKNHLTRPDELLVAHRPKFCSKFYSVAGIFVDFVECFT